MWEEGYFPPPEDQPPQEDRFSPTRTYGESAHFRHRYSPSVSPRGTPSEPTIDLSAWSPRSYQLLVSCPNRTISTSQLLDFPDSERNRHSSPLKLTVPRDRSPIIPHFDNEGLPLGDEDLPQAPKHTKPHIIATPDLHIIPDLPRICSLIHAFFLTIPNPVAINCLSFLQDIDYRTNSWAMPPTKLSARLCPAALTQHRRGRQNRETWGKLPNSLSFNPTFLSSCAEYKGQTGGPLWPKENISSSSLTLTGQAQYQGSYPPLSAHTHSAIFGNGCENPKISDSYMDHSKESCLIVNLDQEDTQAQMTVPPKCHMITNPSVNATDTTPSLTTLPRKKKGKNMPTRRSERLQAQQQLNHTVPNSPIKARNHTYKLPLSVDSHLSALDTSKAMEVLQATGLLITKQVEELIEEATRQDQAAQTSEEAAPSTPVHDPIPPLSIPGTNLFL